MPAEHLAAIADEPIHLLVSTWPAAVYCGCDPRQTLLVHVTTLARLATCTECRRRELEELRHGR